MNKKSKWGLILVCAIVQYCFALNQTNEKIQTKMSTLQTVASSEYEEQFLPITASLTSTKSTRRMVSLTSTTNGTILTRGTTEKLIKDWIRIVMPYLLPIIGVAMLILCCCSMILFCYCCNSMQRKQAVSVERSVTILKSGSKRKMKKGKPLESNRSSISSASCNSFGSADNRSSAHADCTPPKMISKQNNTSQSDKSNSSDSEREKSSKKHKSMIKLNKYLRLKKNTAASSVDS